MDQLRGYASSGSECGGSEAVSVEPRSHKRGKRKKVAAVETVETEAVKLINSREVSHADGEFPERSMAWLPSPLELLSSTDQSGLQKLKQQIVWRDRHQGRVRSFPHVEGNFSTSVFIDVPTPPDQRKRLATSLRHLKAAFPGLQPVNVSGMDQADLVQSEYHLSLSRTVSVRREQIKPLIESLRTELCNCKRVRVSLGPLTAFTNDEKSRTFVSLLVAEGNQEVCSTIRKVDAAMALHALPLFYDDPKPHVSIAWVLGDVAGSMHRAIAGYRDVDGSQLAWQWQWPIDDIKCRIGRKTYLLWSLLNALPPDQCPPALLSD